MKNIISIFLLYLLGCTGAEHSNSGVTIRDAISIAKLELCRQNSSFCEVDFELIGADEKNSHWNKYIKLQPQVIDADYIKEMALDRKKYWAIFFLKKKTATIINDSQVMIAGDQEAFLFIEKGTGRLLGFSFGV